MERSEEAREPEGLDESGGHEATIDYGVANAEVLMEHPAFRDLLDRSEYFKAASEFRVANGTEFKLFGSIPTEHFGEFMYHWHDITHDKKGERRNENPDAFCFGPKYWRTALVMMKEYDAKMFDFRNFAAISLFPLVLPYLISLFKDATDGAFSISDETLCRQLDAAIPPDGSGALIVSREDLIEDLGVEHVRPCWLDALVEMEISAEYRPAMLAIIHRVLAQYHIEELFVSARHPALLSFYAEGYSKWLRDNTLIFFGDQGAKIKEMRDTEPFSEDVERSFDYHHTHYSGRYDFGLEQTSRLLYNVCDPDVYARNILSAVLLCPIVLKNVSGVPNLGPRRIIAGGAVFSYVFRVPEGSSMDDRGCLFQSDDSERDIDVFCSGPDFANVVMHFSDRTDVQRIRYREADGYPSISRAQIERLRKRHIDLVNTGRCPQAAVADFPLGKTQIFTDGNDVFVSPRFVSWFSTGSDFYIPAPDNSASEDTIKAHLSKYVGFGPFRSAAKSTASGRLVYPEWAPVENSQFWRGIVSGFTGFADWSRITESRIRGNRDRVRAISDEINALIKKRNAELISDDADDVEEHVRRSEKSHKDWMCEKISDLAFRIANPAGTFDHHSSRLTHSSRPTKRPRMSLPEDLVDV